MDFKQKLGKPIVTEKVSDDKTTLTKTTTINYVDGDQDIEIRHFKLDGLQAIIKKYTDIKANAQAEIDKATTAVGEITKPK
jgi:hypothetical protein